MVESVLCNSGKFCGVEKTIFQDNISNDMLNIINKSELTLTNPNIKDEGKSILNQNYILIKKSSPELENKIYGEGTVEIDEEIIPQGENFDFEYLDKKIHESNNHEVILDHDITFENYESDFYEGGIDLDIDDLIIDGNGHTIDGADKSRIFIITGKNITLKNITFKNGHSHKNYDNPLNQHGGAIKINHNSKITIKNCEFINNTSEEDGGAINNRGELTITESTLQQNTAKEDGGAINNNKGGELTITESTLQQNTAKEDGGAIHNNKGGELTITESTLTENTAQRHSGAITNSGELTITESTLTENTAQRHSGAIHNRGELTITESTLTENIAQEYGGAIHNTEGGELTITESTLTENTSQEYGGAIHNTEGGELTITESTLTENTSQEYGGAIHNRGELTITESTLTENTAQYDGGAIHNTEGGELTITESTLTENTAQERDGGAIYSNKEINISNCTLVNNLQSSFSFVEKNNNGLDIAWNDDFISSYDVTIYLDNKCDGEYHIVDNLIEWNKILSKGPHEIIFELKDNNKIIRNFTYSPDIITTNVNNYEELINSINKANYILTPQYIINLNKGDYNATKTIVWKSFSNSNLIINGNGITLNGQNKCQFIKIGTNSKLTLNNIILTNFTSEWYGGAIHNWGELTITESTLTGNTASYGGAIYNDEGELTITESTLNNNTAERYGGAINNLEGELTITESTLTENTAHRYGGAINNKEGELTITESTLTENTAHRYGGAIHNLDEKSFKIKDCELDNNIPNDY